MLTKITAIAALAATASALLVGVGAAGPVASKQRVAIQHTGSKFVLTALTPGAVKPDTGAISFCCWTEHHVVRDGQDVDINDPQMTLTGKLGTLVARNVVAYADVAGGWAIFTGTWKVIRGTGQYAGLAGGGRAAGISYPTNRTNARFEGFVSPK
jgi:hypothetical protein